MDQIKETNREKAFYEVTKKYDVFGDIESIQDLLHYESTLDDMFKWIYMKNSFDTEQLKKIISSIAEMTFEDEDCIKYNSVKEKLVLSHTYVHVSPYGYVFEFK